MITDTTVQYVSDTSNEFEWDKNKARRNLQKHGVSFEQACSAFDDAYAMVTYDTLHSDTEDRYQLLGMANGALFLLIIFTERDVVRIISARKANEKEVERYVCNRKTFA